MQISYIYILFNNSSYNVNYMQIFKYKILPDLELIIDFFKGSFNYQEIIMYKIEQSKDPLWNEKYNILADIRNLELDYSQNDIVEHLAESRDAMKLQSKRRTAAITLKPKQVVFGVLVQQNLSEEVAMEVEYFSTIEAAISWLGCASSKKELISNTLNLLNKN